MSYITDKELADYLGIDIEDLPNDYERLISRAFEMIDSYTMQKAGITILIEVEETVESWQKNADYEIGDIVEHESTTYVCIQNHKATPPTEPSNLAYWLETEPTVTEEEIRIPKFPEVRKAVAAQVEWWIELGDEMGMAALFRQISIGSFSAMTGNGQQAGSGATRLAPRVRDELFKAGLLYTGVGLR